MKIRHKKLLWNQNKKESEEKKTKSEQKKKKKGTHESVKGNSCKRRQKEGKTDGR